MTRFHFWFEDKIHDNCILETLENSQLVTCLQKCRSDVKCSGMALGPLKEERDEFVRTCHILSNITESDCYNNNDCRVEGFQLFHVCVSFTSIKFIYIGSVKNSSTANPQAEITTTESTTTLNSPSTTAKLLTSTESSIAPFTKSLTITESHSTPSTETPFTTTNEAETTTPLKTTTTTEATACSDEDKISQSSECKAKSLEAHCNGRESSIFCRDEPREQLTVFGLVATAPLFSDANMQVRCKNEFSESIFKMDSRKDTYIPFGVTMGCNADQAITGIDVCFQGDLKYVSVECNTVQPDYVIENATEEAGNSKSDPARAVCPSNKSMISLRLNKDSSGEINVKIGCSKIIKK
ncbi:uncharacterized protein NPIL_277211 [Nephila pilipes]|uniref:Uncharacterized protein n=1 Tax=Nephila pilipes TaxID=299642 RepID=A0A8X6NJN8_NEPPI|nr:uncharacterized protein NPIL_277211 [Nephila pilipes]